MHCTACDAELILTNVAPGEHGLLSAALSTTRLFARDAISYHNASSSLHETWTGGGPKAPSKSI
jgi:hypothetical protein